MTQILLDTTLASKLNGLSGPVELCDPSGQVLGRFLPLVDLSEWEAVTPEPSEEELEKLAASNQRRYTTAEVIAHLEKL